MDIPVFKLFTTLVLFFVTAIMEILGCYFPYLILNQGKSQWLWLPTILALAAFVWLLTLHPAASGRIYAAYGGIYIFTALIWLRFVDQVALYDAVILAVAHEQFVALGAEKIRALGKENHVLYDLKYVLDQTESDIRL